MSFRLLALTPLRAFIPGTHRTGLPTPAQPFAVWLSLHSFILEAVELFTLRSNGHKAPGPSKVFEHDAVAPWSSFDT